MRKRLAKELHPLLLPWAVALSGAAVIGLATILSGRNSAPDELSPGSWKPIAALFSFLVTVAPMAFFFGLAAIPGLTFGSEFYQRTLPVLFAQPISRSRLWLEKMSAQLIATGTLLAISAIIIVSAETIHARWFALAFSLPKVDTGDYLLVLFYLGLICSAPLWTTVARSTIGGLVFSAATQFFVALIVVLAIQKLWKMDFSPENANHVGFLVGAGLIYCPVTLWLGWRRFQRLQISDTTFGEGGARSETFGSFRMEISALRCRPESALLNLFRKEVRLNKPLFVIAAVFVLCWLLLYSLLWTGTIRTDQIEPFFVALFSVYCVIVPWLGGCISVAEEKTLATAQWHLTLPVTARRQWLIKILSALSTGLVLGVVVPWLLAIITGFKVNQNGSPPFHLNPESDFAVFFTWVCIFIPSFWAATLLGNAMKAALGAVVLFGTLGTSCLFASWCADQVGGFQTPLFLWIVGHSSLGPEDLVIQEHHWVFFLLAVPVLCAALYQSLRQFGRLQTSNRTLFVYSAILCGMTWVLAVWAFDAAKFGDQLAQFGNLSLVPAQDIPNAVAALQRAEPGPEWTQPQGKTIRVEELEHTGKLSHSASLWLKHASITAKESNSAKDSIRRYRIAVSYPNGWHFSPEGAVAISR